jgi:hypothetical protein
MLSFRVRRERAADAWTQWGRGQTREKLEVGEQVDPLVDHIEGDCAGDKRGRSIGSESEELHPFE